MIKMKMKLFQGDKKGLQADQGPLRGGRGKHVIILDFNLLSRFK